MYQPPDEKLQQYIQKEAERFWADAGRYMITDGFRLTPDSLVMDVGGYKGDFTDYIIRRYNCLVNAYEPVKEFSYGMRKRFEQNKKITVYNYGLEDRDYSGPISRFDDASSMFYFSFDRRDERVYIRDIASEITSVDLLALNCEGGEYGILNRLLQTNQIINVKNLLVQFHSFIPDCENRSNAIRTGLAKTHRQLFFYDFCWEAWVEK